jgi:exopolysaccharide production protein ExoZ
MVSSSIAGAKEPQILGIQYLRAAAALMVVFHHAIVPQSWLFDPLAGFDVGARGVDIFFVISGFVMFTAARNEPILTFYFRRVIRVVPLYWLATIASASLHVVQTGDGISRLNLLKSFMFIPFSNPTHGGLVWPLLVPGWTLNYEMFFYFIFGLALLLRKPVAFTGGVILTLVATGFLAQPSGAIAVTYTQPILLEFLAGILVAKAYQRFGFRRFAPALPLGVCVLMAGQFTHIPSPITGGIGATLIVIGVLALEHRSSVRSWPFPLLLGKASYSIYLVHFTLWEILGKLWATLPLNGWVQFFSFVTVVIGASIVVGILAHKYIEVPMTRSLRSLSGGWKSKRAILPTPITENARTPV